MTGIQRHDLILTTEHNGAYLEIRHNSEPSMSTLTILDEDEKVLFTARAYEMWYEHVMIPIKYKDIISKYKI